MIPVKIKNLVKEFGEVRAVDGVSFRVEEGEIFGLIGPNGAGKTTILRIISTLLGITSGKVEIFGKDVEQESLTVRKYLSYLPEEAGAYDNLTGKEYLEFMAGFFGDESWKEVVEKGKKIANLNERLDDKVENYSKGMTRRLLVGRALMMEPNLAILDEPTSGLDVMNSQEVRKIISDFSERETTVLLSSHNMFEVEYLCDTVGMMNKGKLVELGEPSVLKSDYGADNLEEVFVEVIS